MDEMNETMVDEVIEDAVENVADVTNDFKNVGFIGLGIAATAVAGFGIYKACKFAAPKIAKAVENFKDRKKNATDETNPDTFTIVESNDVVDQEK